MALGGALLGLAARYLLPGRESHGSVLVPAIGTAVASVIWVLLTWLGLAWNGGWIWWISLGAAAVASIAADIVFSRARTGSDRQLFHTLMKTGVPGH